jgi:hypothetical protein
MSEDTVSKLGELTCPFCGGPATSAEFLHKAGCPTLSPPPPITFTATSTNVPETQEAKLLRQILHELEIIREEIVMIRLRIR